MIIEMKNRENTEESVNVIPKSEVTICNDGNPILKVEVGTTLKVIKLLCETVQLKKSQIIGVKPKTDEHSAIPCVLTLDETKLDQHFYDLILTESQSKITDEAKRNEPATLCTTCANGAKTYISIGTNTEFNFIDETEKSNSELRKELEGGEQENLRNIFRSHKDYKLLIRKHEIPVTENGFSKSSKALSNLHEELVGFNHSPNEIESSIDHHLLKKQFSYLQQKPFKELSPHYTNNHHNYHNLFDHARNNYNNLSPTTSSYKSKIYDKHSSSYLSKSDSLSPRRYASGYHYHLHQTYRHPFHSNEYKRSKWGATSRHFDYNSDLIKISEKLNKDDYAKIIQETPPALIHMRGNKERRGSTADALPQNQPSAPPQRVEEPPVFVLPNDFDINSETSKIHNIDRQHIHQNSDPVSYQMQKVKDTEEPAVEKYAANQVKNGDAAFCRLKGNSPINSIEEINDSPDSSTNVEQKLHCKICNSSFTTKSLLYKHLRGHTSDEKPFKCSECGQGFTLSSNLRQHRIIHRGYKPFQCEFCGKKFMRSNVYKQHRRIHTGEEMHKCTLCPSEFLQKYALIKHMKKNHNIDAADI